VSSPASERGGHARPRRRFAPRPRDSGNPGRPDSGNPGRPDSGNPGRPDSGNPGRPDSGAPDQRDAIPPRPGVPGTPGPYGPSGPGQSGGGPSQDGGGPGQNGGMPGQNGRASGPASVPSGQNGTASRPRAARPARLAPGGSRPARHVAPSSAARPARKSSPAVRRAKRSRIAALAIVAVGVLVIGLATGFGSELSAEPTAQAFLFDWQQQQYAAASALTTAAPDTVTADLRGAFAQLDATQLFLTMKSVVQHGGTAQASFMATVDLAQQGRVWTYRGQFGLRRVNGAWKVDWTPGVVNPSLGPGDRLAVVTQFPVRASVLDTKGDPLQLPAPAYVLGVWPERLSNQAATAQAFARITKVQTGQVLGQIAAAPPDQFLRLATLDSATYASMRSHLREVPGLVVRPESQRLFQAEATGLVGEVGSEISERLRADGALYAPGATVGLSGLEQHYQSQLVGTPTTEVVVVNSAGAQTAVLDQWPGAAGTPVRTTINPTVQNAALTALDSVSNSGEIVAVQASTGDVLAVAQHQASGALPAGGALTAKLVPGAAFTIVSAAALVSHDLVEVSTPISCTSSLNVGGQTFTSDGTGAQKPFSADFAEGCSTAFAGLSERLTTSQWAQVVREFGIGANWSQLPVPAFSGSVPSAAGGADLAAQTIGQGNVRMSLLSMAMVAATVDVGRWHVPQVIRASSDPASTPGTTLDPEMMSALRGLMRGAVRSGAARAASVRGAQVYGQVGLVHTASGWMSWFVGYRGDIAIAAIESGKTPQLSAAALARTFFSAVR
jgi:cell division protein FtsI/penicillin-binding protein 2